MQTGARAGAIGNVAEPYGTSLEAAVKARAKDAAQKYGKAFRASVPADDPAFKTLMERPSMQSAAARAQKLAEEAGETVPEQPAALVGQPAVQP